MLPAIGHGSLVMSIFVITCILVAIITNKRRNHEIYNRKIILIGVSIYILLITVSFISLVRSHILSDFAINNVYSSSHSTQPLLFKICGLWGNHEGSMLLWIWILSVYTYSITLLREIPYSFLKWTIINQLLINLFFILYTLLTSNPFLSNHIAIYDGKELNPILQDIVLSIHPPLIYLGYIGLSIPFSMTTSYLINKGNFFFLWLKYVERYNLLSWLFLTLGIFLGSWWAYYELGWGGWWFWDPVENASLLPWILSTALIHTIITTKRTKTLLIWTSIVAILGFYSSILGTFFVRSGFLDSVHSFASDSNRGFFILSFLICIIIYLLPLYLYNLKYINIDYIYKILSREGLVLLNQIFFLYFYLIVAIGTFYPTLYELLYHKSITIGPSFYNQAIIPVVIPFIVIMSFSVDSIWRHSLSLKINKFFSLFIYILCLLLGLFVYILLKNNINTLMYYIMLFLLIWSLVWTLKKSSTQGTSKTLQMQIAHLGFIVLTAGISFWYFLSKEGHYIMYPGDRCFIGDYEYIFRGINLLKGSNYDCFYGSYIVLKDGVLVSILFPEKRHYYIQDFYTSKVDIHSNIFYDLHVIIGDGNIYTGWATSIYIYPFMSWIWIGAILLILAAIYSIYKKSFSKQKF